MLKTSIVPFICFVILLSIASCSGRHVDEKPETTPPTVLSTSPANGATAIAVSTAVTATFSEAMDPLTIKKTSFLLSSASSGTVTGIVTYDTASNVATFTSGSVLEHNTTYTATITSDAHDLAGNGLASSYSWAFMTVPAPGSLDVGFGTNGRVRESLGSGDDIAHAAAIQQDGKIITAGLSALSSFSSTTNHFTIARFQPSGALDTNFNPPTVLGKNDYFTGRAFAAALQPDGKIVAAGSNIDLISPNFDMLIVRYNENGSRDTGFGNQPTLDGSSVVNMGGTEDSASALAIQTDGSMIVTGLSTTDTKTFRSVIAKIKNDGTLDSTFGVNGKIVNSTYATSRAILVKIQAEDMILVGGTYKEVDETTAGLTSSYLMRYNATGVLDPFFGLEGVVTLSTGTNTQIKAMELLSSGKILIAGTTTNATKDLFLMQFNSDGSPDDDFGTSGMIVTDDVNHGDTTAAGLVVQVDGKIVVAATYFPKTGSNPSNDFAVFRYNADGAIDTTFGSGGFGMVITDFGSSDQATGVQLQQDGKIVVVGASWNGLDYDIGLARYWP